ncbi:dihydrolipoyllysine-residue acetyltransferase [soil metagenome]
MTSPNKIQVPNIGDFTDVEVIEVHVKEGDTVAVEDALITIETEKAAMDVPSPAAGSVVSVAVKTGDKVSEGSEICELDSGGKESEGNGDTEAEGGEDEPEKPADGGTSGKKQDAEEKAANGPEDDTKPDKDDVDDADEVDEAGEGTTREDVKVPDIGDFADVEVIEVHVAAGDDIAAEDSLITLETEKAAMDVPAPGAGKVVEVHVKAGDKVSEGDRILSLEPAEGKKKEPKKKPKQEKAGKPDGPEEQAESAEKPSREPSGKKSKADPAAGSPERGPARLPPIDEETFGQAHASPAVRKFARELGADLGNITGSGKKGRITAEDVKAFVKKILAGGGVTGKSALPKLPEIDFTKFGEVAVEPLSRIRKIAAPRLQASWINLPHVTQFDEADISDMEELRKSRKQEADEHGIKLTPLAFIMRACAMALKDFPRFNASLDTGGENLVFKKYMHIGFAADTEQGLLVPVVRDADKKDIYELAAELGELAGRARDGKLKADQMQGGSFTISSLGGIGGTAFTPIVNAPEVAILGVSRARMTPVYRDGGFVPRLMLPLSLSYDHRVIDGADAARFTRRLAEALEDAPALVQAIP